MAETPTLITSDRLALIQQAALRSGTLTAAPGVRQKQSPFDVSQISGVSISHIERTNIDGSSFIAELRWLRSEAQRRFLLDAELWASELLAYCPEKMMSYIVVGDEEPMDLRLGDATSTGTVERFRREQQSQFALSLMRDRDFRRAAWFLNKTRHSSDLDYYLYYRCRYLTCMQEHLENDAEGVERSAKAPGDKAPFAELYNEMVDEGARDRDDVFLQYLLGLLEVDMGLKSVAFETMKGVVTKEPRMWAAWDAMVRLVVDIETADQIVVDSQDRSLWMSEWFMVLVLERFQQDMLAISKAEALVKRGLTNMPFIIAQIAACSNHRHDHDQAIANFEQIRQMDPMRIKDLHLYSDSLYIRGDQRSLSQLALTVFQTHKFRWETCCIVANYYAIRRDSEQAIKYFQRALRLNPGVASIWVLIGHEFMEIKNNSAACVSYRKAIEVDPADYRGWYGLGQLYDIMKMPSYSLYYYQEAQKCRPHDSRMLVALGEVYGKLNRVQDAEKCFSGAYLFGDIEGSALWQLAKLYEHAADDDRAAQTFEVYLLTYDRLTNMEENVVYSVAFLANHYFRKRNMEKAIEYASRCLDYDSICQEGNRLQREINKLKIKEEVVESPDEADLTLDPMVVASDDEEDVSY